ncbi:MAG: hypothetical protein LAO21_10580 [Acidobacteriia bacterium]|nr:hypothetical protein [Terriglobia bacterium]
MNCWHCGYEIDLRSHGGIGKKDECPNCEDDLHVCRNCRFFDPGAESECSEPIAEWVRDKDRANSCEYFAVVDAVEMGRRPGDWGTDEARKAWDRLFKG